MKLAIVSDSHNAWNNLEKAIVKAHALDCQIVFHAGDIASPKGIALLAKFHGEVYFVLGNNDKDVQGFEREAMKYKNVHYCGETYQGTIDNIAIYMNHFPSIVRSVAKTEQYELCIYGHEHSFGRKEYGKTLFIKPGALIGDKYGKIGFIVYDTASHKVKYIDIK